MSSSQLVLQEHLAAGIKQLGLAVDESVQALLLAYLNLLERWNKAYNLTAIREPQQMIVRHLLDSLSILPYLKGQHLLDVGTGAGLPGIPLALADPEAQWVLLDSNGKKMRFLFQVVQALKLSNVQLVQQRVEEYRPQQEFTSITSRAFSSLSEMLKKTTHLLAPAGQLLAMKGIYPTEELQALPESFTINTYRLQVPGLDEQRHLICMARG